MWPFLLNSFKISFYKLISSQDLDEIDFQSIAREVKEFGEWNFIFYVNLMFISFDFIFPDFISIYNTFCT